MTFDLGRVVPLQVKVRDENDDLANAGSMTLSITQPDGTAATVTNPVAPSSTGVYDYDFTPTQAGLHQVRWVATGANAGAYTDVFDVDPAASTAIVSLADAKAHLNIDPDDTTQDAELRGHIAAASAWVESKVGPVARRTYVDVVKPSGGLLILNNTPVLSLTSVEGAYGYTGTYVVADLFLDADAGIVHQPYASTFATGYPLTVTYEAGRAVVPAAMRMATLEVVKGLWDSQRGPAQSALEAEVGGVDETPGMGLTYWRAEKLLAPYSTASVVA